MKHIKKGLLSLMVLATMPLIAAQDKTIHVTTFADEDGTNAGSCSIREAIKTAALNKAYGGCSAGNTTASASDVIQLESGIYTLDRELQPTSSISIFGASPVSYAAKDPITNTSPARTALTTTLLANSSRFFNTTDSAAGLVLNNLILSGGRAPNSFGGALYLGGSTTLNRTIIRDASAQNGGVFYLEKTAASLSVNNTVLENNTANAHTILGMSCVDNLDFTAREIIFTNSSIVNNSSPNSSTFIELCGKPNASFTSSTIANNTVNTSNGSILKFTTDSFSLNDAGKLSASSTLSLTNNTIVENNAQSTLLYDSVGSKILRFNVLGFNSDKSCRYLPGNIASASETNVLLLSNALNLTGNNSVCDIAKDVLLNSNNTPTNNSTLDVGNNPRAQYLTALQPASANTAFLPVYFPINRDNGATVTTDLIDTKLSDCNPTDQRSLARNADSVEVINTSPRNSCDIGAIELSKLTAENLEDAVNTDVVNLVNSYQNGLESNQRLLDDPNTDPDFLPFYRDRITEFTELLEGTKANTHFRPIYIDPFAKSVPAEAVTNTGYEIKPLTKQNYTVTTNVVGIGTTLQSATLVPEPRKLSCEWDPKLQFIVMYKNDDLPTKAGEFFFCTYTLTLNSDPTIQSTGVIQAKFNNIAPRAENDEYRLAYGSSQTLSVNLLENDNDLGDGPSTELVNYPNAARPSFYRNANGVELPIRIDTIPAGLTITADRQGPCPGVDSVKTCFGGNLKIQVKNAFNPFDFSFGYQIYDAEGLVSNQATVKLVNTANNIDSSKGGGGSFAWWQILGLLSLVFVRRLSFQNLSAQKPRA